MGVLLQKSEHINISDIQLSELKNQFNYEMFTSCSNDEIKDLVYQWVDHVVNQMVNQTDNNIEDVNANEDVNNVSTPDNQKKKFIPPTLQEVKEYFSEKGYSQESAQKAFEYYAEADWKDSYGKKVISWKQKMIANWFNPENKLNGKPQHKQPDLIDWPS